MLAGIFIAGESASITMPGMFTSDTAGAGGSVAAASDGVPHCSSCMNEHDKSQTGAPTEYKASVKASKAANEFIKRRITD